MSLNRNLLQCTSKKGSPRKTVREIAAFSICSWSWACSSASSAISRLFSHVHIHLCWHWTMYILDQAILDLRIDDECERNIASSACQWQHPLVQECLTTYANERDVQRYVWHNWNRRYVRLFSVRRCSGRYKELYSNQLKKYNRMKVMGTTPTQF